MTWDGQAYQERFDELAASGNDVHGEVAFVLRYQPGSVLDAGCGTGRVAIELARRGVDVLGADIDPSMLAFARQVAPELDWVQADLCSLYLDRQFDIVVMAGNVVLFTQAGTQAALVAACARHMRTDGRLVAGFSRGRGYDIDSYDAVCTASGLVLESRWSTWDQALFDPSTSDYVVSVHTLFEQQGSQMS